MTACTFRKSNLTARPIPMTARSTASVCGRPFALGLWVRIPSRAWLPVSCESCVLSGRGLCVGLITRPEEPTNCVSECHSEASKMRRAWPTRGRRGDSVTPRGNKKSHTNKTRLDRFFQFSKYSSASCMSEIHTIISI
jgi:hypothetical protein